MCAGAQSTDYARERCANHELMKQLIHYATASEDKPCFTSGTVASRVLQGFALVERDVLTFTEHMNDDANSNAVTSSNRVRMRLSRSVSKRSGRTIWRFLFDDQHDEKR